jgi:RimJ/RimL family protein N-acetyltransferase
MIKGNKIELVPATLDDRQVVYDWCFHCETSKSHCGLPDFPDVVIPTYEEFLEDYVEYYFTGAELKNGRGFMIVSDSEEREWVGFISYACFHLKPNIAELDIWLNSEKHCGKGYGTDAIVSLCDYLSKTLGIREFIMRPSPKNERAIKSYKKSGFEESDKSPSDYLRDEYLELYGDGDYGIGGDVLLVKRMKLACKNVPVCSCPKTDCPNHSKCCDCVVKHREGENLPYCLRFIMEESK